MNDENEQEILVAFSNIIARHADWLSGRDFQRLAQISAEGYFDADDLDSLFTPEQFASAISTALTSELIAEALAT